MIDSVLPAAAGSGTDPMGAATAAATRSIFLPMGIVSSLDPTIRLHAAVTC
jgi:hypothetical protein